jgi:hypothetical protein
MGINQAFTIIANNLGMSLSIIILIGTMVGTLIFYAQDYRLGLMISFFMTGLNFMLDYALDLEYVNTLVCLFMFLALLAFSLFISSKTQTASNLL